eukprot:186769_1
MSLWINTLKIGDELDVHDMFYHFTWMVANIIDIQQTRIKVNLVYHDQWFDKISTQIAPLHTHTLHTIKLNKPISHIDAICSRPLYYKSNISNKSYIIIIMDTNDDKCIRNVNINTCIVLYDINNDSYSHINYPKNVCLKFHCSAINPENSDLYIYSQQILTIYNLETKQWNMTKIFIDLIHPQLIYIPSPCQELHLFGIAKRKVQSLVHYKYSFKSKKIIPLNGINDTLYLKNFGLIYIAFQKRLMIFGGSYSNWCVSRNNGNEIWFFDLCARDNYENEWKLYCEKLPYESTDFTSIVAYDYIIFVLYFKRNENKEIWCLDLIHCKWYKSKKIYPLKYAEHVTKTNRNNGHFIYCGDMAFHVKIDLFHLIPE